MKTAIAMLLLTACTAFAEFEITKQRINFKKSASYMVASPEVSFDSGVSSKTMSTRPVLVTTYLLKDADTDELKTESTFYLWDTERWSPRTFDVDFLELSRTTSSCDLKKMTPETVGGNPRKNGGGMMRFNRKPDVLGQYSRIFHEGKLVAELETKSDKCPAGWISK